MRIKIFTCASSALTAWIRNRMAMSRFDPPSVHVGLNIYKRSSLNHVQ